MAASKTVDYSTLSNAEEIKADHFHLDLNVDFDKQELAGEVTFTDDLGCYIECCFCVRLLRGLFITGEFRWESELFTLRGYSTVI